MGKMYFYYGTMGAGKTALAINKAYEFKERELQTYVYVPSEIKSDKLSSRCGASVDVSNINLDEIDEHSVLIVDEAQFLSHDEVKTIRDLCTYKDVMAFCFGLLTTFQRKLFDGTKYIIECADTIREVPCMCENCKKKAIYNLRVSSETDLKVLGKDKYKSFCHECFEKENNF